MLIHWTSFSSSVKWRALIRQILKSAIAQKFWFHVCIIPLEQLETSEVAIPFADFTVSSNTVYTYNINII